MSTWLLPLFAAAAAGLVLVAFGLRAIFRRFSKEESLGRAVASAADDSLGSVRHRARREALVLALSLASGLATAALMMVLDGMFPRMFGLAMALAGSVGAIVGLLVFNVLPRPGWPSIGGNRSAELVPREPWSFGRHWAFVAPLAASVLLVLGLLAAGVASSVDEQGHFRAYTIMGVAGWGIEDGSVIDIQSSVNRAGPFPGWYYGIPLIAGTLLLVGVVYWSLRRVALTPRPATADLFALDTALRTLRTRFVMAASSAALGVQIAGLSLFTGIVLRSAHTNAVPIADIEQAMPFSRRRNPGTASASSSFLPDSALPSPPSCSCLPPWEPCATPPPPCRRRSERHDRHRSGFVRPAGRTDPIPTGGACAVGGVGRRCAATDRAAAGGRPPRGRRHGRQGLPGSRAGGRYPHREGRRTRVNPGQATGVPVLAEARSFAGAAARAGLSLEEAQGILAAAWNGKR